MTDKEWWETVCEDVRQLVFNRLDTEEGITGDEAGQMAHAAEMAVHQAFERIQSADASDRLLATPPWPACPKCGRPSGGPGHIVNECQCDKNNLPTVTKCHCMRPGPLCRPFGTTFTVVCKGCGGNLMDKAGPTVAHRLASKLGAELEAKGNTFLAWWERLWLEERHKANEIHPSRTLAGWEESEFA